MLLPTGADQFWNAALAAESGLAAVLEPDDVDPDTIARLGAAELGSLRPAAGARADPARRRVVAGPAPEPGGELCEAAQSPTAPTGPGRAAPRHAARSTLL